MEERTNNCFDCGSKLQAIKLVDERHGPDKQIGYSAGNAERSYWLGVFPKLGKVGAMLCQECGRITLHAEPGKQD
jgi:hypothetical protein